MIFIWLLLHGFGRNVLQAANGFLICTQLDVAGCLVLQMKKALYVGQGENVSNGVSEDLFPDTRQSSTYRACYVLWIPGRKEPPGSPFPCNSVRLQINTVNTFI